MIHPGTWWLLSPSDKRWCVNGHANAVGGFYQPKELKQKLEELKKLYGDPPDDLEWGYMKD